MKKEQDAPALPPWRVDKHRLAQYRLLLCEIREDRLRLAGLASRLSSREPAVRTAEGRDTVAVARSTARVAENLARAALLAEELEEFISSIDDSLLRRLFTMRYVSGYTWKRIAFLLHYSDESSVRKLHDRYLRRLACGDVRAAMPRKTHMR